MPKGILLVESRPVSPDREQDYNHWYDETHLPELVALPGFLSAKRFKPTDGDGPYVAVYEIEDTDTVMKTMSEAATSGQLHMSDAMQTDPPPGIRILEFHGGRTPTGPI